MFCQTLAESHSCASSTAPPSKRRCICGRLLRAQCGSWAAPSTQHSAVTSPPLQVVYPALDVKVTNVTLAYTVEHEDEERLFDQLSALIGDALVQQGKQRGVTLRALVCKVRLPGADGRAHAPAAVVCPHQNCRYSAKQAMRCSPAGSGLQCVPAWADRTKQNGPACLPLIWADWTGAHCCHALGSRRTL